MLSILITLSASSVQQFKTSINRAMFRFCVIVSPIIWGLLLGMIYKEASLQDFTLFALLGSGLSTFWASICFSSASDIHRERWYGTLENIYAAPAGFRWIVLGKIIGNSLWGMMSIAISFFVVWVVYKRPLVIEHPLWFIIGLLIMTLSLIAIGYFMAGLFTLSRNARLMMNFMEFPVYILCGILFPITLLPKALQYVGHLLSPTWAIKLLRYSITGEGTYNHIYGLILLTIIYIILADVFFNAIDRKCRIDATLEVY